MKQLVVYEASNGRQPFNDWLFFTLKDKQAAAVITARLYRLSLGHLGDYKPVGDDVFELRIMLGPGYRVYFSLEADTIVLLLCGGNKTTQHRDIRTAKTYLNDYRSQSDA